MTTGLLLTSLAFGLRHGFDWDHIAAIADLSSTSESRRHGFVLSLLYALCHALVVIVLGVAAIMFGAALPPGIDVWMGRVVGVTLVGLGAWVLIELFRKGHDFRLRSRWILVINGTFAGLRRVRQAQSKRRLLISHDHRHEHAGPTALNHLLPQTHDHAHQSKPAPLGELALAGPGSLGTRSRVGHRHAHHHETALTERATTSGNGTAAGIGLLHGVGFESPTQIAIFVASTSVVGLWSGFGLLVAWVVGLLVANSILAGLAGFGLLGAERNFKVYAAVSATVGVASLAMGISMLLGFDGVQPIAGSLGQG